MNDVKIGACDWALPGAGLNAARIAADFGLEALSLKIGLYENDYPISHGRMQRYYLDDQQRYGIDYCAIALNDFDNIPIYAEKGSPDFQRVRTLFDRGVRTAAALHIPVIQVPCFAASELKTESHFERASEGLRYLCGEAGERGITVAGENLLNPSEFEKLLHMVDKENFRAYYDSQNYHLFRGYDQLEILKGLYPHMTGQLHVKDGRGAMSGALLGTGGSNFHGTMRTLKEHGFKGYILLENYYDQLPLRLESDDPYSLLAMDIDTLRQALGDG
ncbi:MAG: sugar phosphate isomerase/epimerase [Synergistaceae bacterium]|nr:sugar phosphate isomerase/epimerase [Synergistaceae bacterium]